MEEIILRFLKGRYDESRPILIGLSGGPDSMALLYLFLKCSAMMSLKLGIAHVDHRWRQESQQEAETLRKLAESLHLPFHLKILDPHAMQGNLEAACREARYQFFVELVNQYGYQAVALGHHQDDQAETVLKRILEGASLVKLRGISETIQQGKLTIWRPLLSLKKTKILDWLSANNILFFNDKTNLDPQFLRGKMRSSLIPYLSQEFGKEVKPSLVHLGQEAEELERFLQQHLQPYYGRARRGPMGAWLDLSHNPPSTAFEIKQLLRVLANEEGGALSRVQLETAAHFIQTKQANKSLERGGLRVQFDRGHVFIVKKQKSAWKATWESTHEPVFIPDWQNVWQGKFWAVLPWESNFRIDLPKMGIGNWLDKWWTNHKVPTFLRWHVPVVWQNNRVIYEFLSGKMNTCHDKIKEWVKVTLEYSI